MTTDLCFLNATELAASIRSGELSSVELTQAHIDRIERVNPAVNAVVTFLPEQALEKASAADAARARGDALGPLHGLPMLHKDTTDTAGIRTTYGSPIHRHNVPVQSQLIIERLHAAGAIPMGKTNVPEFGAGSQSFNPVFGATGNPYDPTKTCGGSSGGQAVALACGMTPLADGSDMGGSLRNPANFCNVVGFRLSPGRVPVWPSLTGWSGLSVQGPMGRTVADVALLLAAVAGPDDRSPIAQSEPPGIFARPLQRDFSGARIAYSADLGASFPVDPRVTGAIEAQLPAFQQLGCQLTDFSGPPRGDRWALPDFSDADEIFKTMRAWSFHSSHGPLLAERRHQMKDTIIWNIEQGEKLSGADLGRAEAMRTELYHAMRIFMQTYEFLLLPVSQVPPFSVDLPYPNRIDSGDGPVEMETYIDWMKSCYFITVTGHPAISVPCGFTAGGLPVGVQIVGRHRDDFGVLQLAHAFEQATRAGERRPQVALAGGVSEH